jgi:hypothetical protein
MEVLFFCSKTLILKTQIALKTVLSDGANSDPLSLKLKVEQKMNIILLPRARWALMDSQIQIIKCK